MAIELLAALKTIGATIASAGGKVAAGAKAAAPFAKNAATIATSARGIYDAVQGSQTGGGSGGGTPAAPQGGTGFKFQEVSGSEIPASVFYERLAAELGEDPEAIKKLLREGVGQKMNGGPLYANSGTYVGGQNNPLGGIVSLIEPLQNLINSSAETKTAEANLAMQTEYDVYVDSMRENPILDDEFFESEGGSDQTMTYEEYASSGQGEAKPYEMNFFEKLAGNYDNSDFRDTLAMLGKMNIPNTKSSGRLGGLMSIPTGGAFQGFKQVGFAAEGKAMVPSESTFMKNYMPNGGDIKGPGGPKEDLIPVMASNGEYMLSKASVDQAGGGNHRRGIARLEEFNRRGNARYG